MEKSVRNLRLRWNILRTISGAIVMLTFVLIMAAIPAPMAIFRALGLIIGIILATFALFRSDLTWARITLLAQGTLFATALLATVSTEGYAESVPNLLLAFMMVLASERILTLISNYNTQFSTRGQELLMGFNVPALGRSLNHLYRRLAWNGVTLGTSYLLSLALLSAAILLGPFRSILSDASLYVLVTSVSLAILIASREE
jgi:hypothetical protein